MYPQAKLGKTIENQLKFFLPTIKHHREQGDSHYEPWRLNNQILHKDPDKIGS